ncbi:MAG: hypothetical protein ACI9W2_000173 [Gammaproteobacteria bacterium]|jgi:hypothetical protein
MLTSEELDDVLVHLARAGLPTALGHRAELVVLLSAQADGFAHPQRLQRAGRLMGPVLCNTAQEQRRYWEAFARWGAQRARREALQGPVPSPVSAPQWQRPEPTSPSRSMSVLGCAALLLTLTVALFSFGNGAVYRSGSDRSWTAVDALASDPGARGHRGEGIRNSDGLGILRLLGFIAPLVILAFWLHWRFLARKLMKDRYPPKKDPGINRFVAKGNLAEILFSKGSLRGLVDFRSVRPQPGRGVDVERSIEASVREGGRLILVPERVNAEQSYVALIELRSANDHGAALARALVQLLEEREVPLEVYVFEGDARTVTALNGVGEPVTLALLSKRYRQARFLVFASPSACYDVVHNVPTPWFSALAEDHLCALVCAERFADAPNAFTALANLGCITVPPTVGGLAQIPSRLDGTGVQIGQQAGLSDQPSWGLGVDATCEAMLDRLSATVDHETLRWIASTALYPCMTFDLTIYLGTHLRDEHGAPLLNAERLLTLLRLPWYRLGRFPEALREALVLRLSGEYARVARDLLFAVLGSALQHEPCATKGPRANKKNKDLVKSYLRSRSAGETLADGLFTRFMLAPTFPLRVLAIPESLSRLLGFRLHRAPIIAVLMAFACMAGFGAIIELLERYFPQFNAFVLAHRMGFGIGLYITLVATWSGFWTAVMLNPRYEKFTSDLWRRRIRLDDFHRPDYR